MRFAGFGEACCVTFFGLAVLVLVVTMLGPFVHVRRKKLFAVASVTACVAFIPICSGITQVVHSYRYGIFHYDSVDDVHDFPLIYLPPTATDITIDSQHGGFRARYRIAETDLEAYLDECWKRNVTEAVNKRDEVSERTPADEIKFHFKGLNWPPLDDVKRLEGPRAARGSGFTVWYNPTQSIAYEDAGYW